MASIRIARASESVELQRICLDADEAFVEVGRPGLAGDPFPLDVLERAIDGGRVLVAVDAADVPIGWVLLAFGAPEPCIAQIAVERAHGRSGIGSALLGAAVDAVASAGHSTVVLNTERDIPWNEPWYRRHGFEVVPVEAWTADMRAISDEQSAVGLDWSTRVHMRRAL